MNLELSYAEMALLRELVRKKQLDIIMKISLEELKECGPVSEITCCVLLLHKLEELEKEVKQALAKAKGKE